MTENSYFEFFNITLADASSVDAVTNNSAIMFATLSIGTWTLITYLLWLYSKGADRSWGTPSNIGILFFAVLVTFVADFIVRYGKNATVNVYNFTKLLSIGMIVCIFGARHLFVHPPDGNTPTIGSRHKNISFIIWLITIPLIILEIVQAAVLLENGYDKVFETMVYFLAIVQKLVQGSIYHFHLSRKVPKVGKTFGAAWYFKLMALFNFSQWIQSIIQAETEEKIPKKMEVVTNIYEFSASTYHALMIDYRLLCCLLFTEHAHEIESHEVDEIHSDSSKVQDFKNTCGITDDERFFTNASRMQKLGLIVGVFILCSQFVNALAYLNMRPEVNLVGITAEILVIAQGLFFINQVRSSLIEGGRWRETNSKGVDLMVGLMGVTGLAFWIFKTMLIATWSSHVPNKYYVAFMWNAVKSGIRALSCLFSIYVYMRTDNTLGCHAIVKYRLRNHFLLPCLMMAFLAVFINSVIDSFNKPIKKEMKRSLSIILFAVYEAGVPLHLGFCLHLFIHFFLINSKMRESLKSDCTAYKHRGDKSPLLGMEDDINNIIEEDDDDVFGSRKDLIVTLLDDKPKKISTL